MRPDESFIAQPIRSLQTMLRVIREDAGYTDNVVPDGIYGSTTMDAVTQFQRNYGLPVTGVTDQQTWETIIRAYQPALVRTVAAQPLQIILNPGQIIKKGERHPYVYLIQVMLLAISSVFSSIPSPPMTGILDIATAESVSAFQYLSGLPQTGQIDKITWKHLALQYPLAVNKHHSENRIQR